MGPIQILEGFDAGRVLALINRLGGRDAAEAILRNEDGVRIERPVPVLEMFAPPADQIARLLEVNEVGWKDCGITEKAIRELGDPPACPPSDDSRLNCVVLLAETGDALVTFIRNWLACRLVHGLRRTWQWDGLVMTPEGVRPRAEAKPRNPGLRWAVAELGRAHKGRCVRDVRPDLDSKKVMGIGQEAPMIAALHPLWAVSMDGDKFPFLDVPDMEVAPDGRGGFSYAPCMSFGRDDGQVGLFAKSVEDDDPGYGSGSLR